jgi:hypothetical protein
VPGQCSNMLPDATEPTAINKTDRRFLFSFFIRMDLIAFLIVSMLLVLIGVCIWFIIYKIRSNNDYEDMLKALDSKNAGAHRAIKDIHSTVASDMTNLDNAIKNQGRRILEMGATIGSSKQDLQYLVNFSKELDGKIKNLNLRLGTIDELTVSVLRTRMDAIVQEQADLKTRIADRASVEQINELKAGLAAVNTSLAKISSDLDLLIKQEQDRAAMLAANIGSMASNVSMMDGKVSASLGEVASLKKRLDDTYTTFIGQSNSAYVNDLATCKTAASNYSATISKYQNSDINRYITVDSQRKTVTVNADQLCFNDGSTGAPVCFTSQQLSTWGMSNNCPDPVVCEPAGSGSNLDQVAGNAEGRMMMQTVEVPVGTVAWAARISGSNNEEGHGICKANDGGVYVTGSYSSPQCTVYNANSSAFPTQLQLPRSSDCFIAKYDKAGSVQWVTRVAGRQAYGYGICSTDNGFCVVGLYERGAQVYKPNGELSATVGATSGSDYGCFIASYNDAGIPQWATFISSKDDQSRTSAICSSTDGGVCVTGSYTGSDCKVYSAGTRAPYTTMARDDRMGGFVVKYNASGVAQWAARIGGSREQYGNGICGAPNGGLYVTGTYRREIAIYHANKAVFSTMMGVSNIVYDYFIVSYNTSGTAQWVTRISKLDGNNLRNGISSAKDGGLYATGTYSGSPCQVFNANDRTAPAATLVNSGKRGCFIVKYNASGMLQWSTRIDGSGDEIGAAICGTEDGGVCVTGSYNSTDLKVYNANGSTFSTLALVQSSTSDCFIARYEADGALKWVTRIGGSANDVGRSICSTSDDGVCVTGTYESTDLKAYNADGAIVGTLVQQGRNDCFIVKYM